MERTVRLAILADYDANSRAHAGLEEALRHAVGTRHRSVMWDWIDTQTLAIEPVSVLSGSNAIVAATDDDCASVDGALAGIRFARERTIPFLAIGGGFRHTVAEFARNVLDMDPTAVPTLADEPRRRRSGAFFLDDGSRTAKLYGRHRSVEETTSLTSLQPALRDSLLAAGLRVGGTDSAGQPTVLELRGHPFFIAALFEPQHASQPLTPAPLVRAVVDAAIHHADKRGTPHGLMAIAG